MPLNITTKQMKEKVQQLKTQIDTSYSQFMFNRTTNIERFQNSWLYYLSKKPAAVENVESDYIEPVLREACDKILPSLLNIFTENEVEAVTFRPLDNRVPAPVARAVNKAINDMYLRQNDGFNVMQTALLEAIVTGDCFVKTFIEEIEHTEELDLEDWTPAEMLTQILQPWPDTDLSKLETRERKVKIGIDEQMLDDAEVPKEARYTVIPEVKGNLELKRIEQKPRIEYVGLTDIVCDDTHGWDFGKSKFVSQKLTMTIADAIEQGFPEEKVENAEYQEYLDVELSTRPLVNLGTFGRQSVETGSYADPKQRLINIFETYIYSSLLDKKGKTRLYQVFHTTAEILQVEEVNRIPFVHGMMEIIPLSFWGSSMYDRLHQRQDILSRMIRLSYQNFTMSTVPRWQAVQGAFDRRSLLNNKPGCVIEVQQIGAIQPFLQQPLPSTFDTIYAKLENSKNSEIATSVGMALDSGSLTNVTAQTMAMSLHNAEMKDKKIAKALARTLVRPLFVQLYEMLRESNVALALDEPLDQQGTMQIPSSALPERPEFYVDVNTSNDNAQTAMQLASMVQTITQASQMPNAVITPENLANIGIAMLKNGNIHDYKSFISKPSDNPPTPEQQKMQQQQEALTLESSGTQLEILKAQQSLLVSQIAKTEVETAELIKDGEAKRQREQEKSVQGFKKLEIEQFSAAMDAQLTAAQGSAVSIG